MKSYANATARFLQVLVGDDLQEWSVCARDFSVGYSQRDESGILYTKGKLKLGMPQIPPDTMNTRSAQGRSRWRKGQRLIINCTDEDGNWQRHPCGWLYLLKTPTPWSPSNQYMELELGCELSLRNFKQPDEILLQNPQGACDRTEAITIALQKAGVKGAFLGVVPKYPVPFMVTKEGTSNVELAGKLAYGGTTHLYQDNQGNIRVVDSSLLPRSPIFTLRIGEGDEIAYDPSDGGETPSEKVRFVGTGINYLYRKAFNSSVAYDYGPGAMVDPALGTNPIVIRITRRTETLEENSAIGRTIREIVEAPLGLISAFAYPKDTGLGLDSDTLTWYSYDGGNNGRLSRIDSTVKRLFPAACGETFASFEPYDQAEFKDDVILAKRSATIYDYSGDQVVQGIYSTTEEPKAAIAPGDLFNVPAELSIAEKKSTIYQKNGPDEWLRREITQQPVGRIQPDIALDDLDGEGNGLAEEDIGNAKLGLMVSQNLLEISSSGQTQPPATEYQPKLWSTEEVPIAGSAYFKEAANPHEPRERTFNLEVGCVGKGQLEELAMIEGTLLLGRSLGQEIQIPFRDELFAHPEPLTYWNVIEIEIAPQGVRKNLVTYLADSIQYTHDPERGVVGCAGIFIGIQEGEWVDFEDFEVTPPEPPGYSAAALVPPYSTVEVSAGADTVDVILPPVSLLRASTFGLGLGFTSELMPFGGNQTLESHIAFGIGVLVDGAIDSSSVLSLGVGVEFKVEDAADRGYFSLGIGFRTEISAIMTCTFGLGVGVLVREIEVAEPLTLSLGFGFSAEQIDVDRCVVGVGVGFTSDLINLIETTYGLGLAFDALGQDYWLTDYGFGLGFRSESTQRTIKPLTYSALGDSNGLIAYLGTNYNTTAFSNPQMSGAIAVSASTIESGTVETLTDRANSLFSTVSASNSWIQLDLGPDRQMQVNYWGLQNHSGGTVDSVRYWMLEGSIDGVNFAPLLSTNIYTYFNAANEWKSGPIAQNYANATQYYRYFRFTIKATNASSNYRLKLGDVELYGTLIHP